MAQSFYSLATPVDCSLGTTAAWTDIDLSGSIPAGATGAIIIVDSTVISQQFGLRKNGSTDDRVTFCTSSQMWAVIGVDANRVIEGYITNTAIDFFVCGYTIAGVTMLTNGVNKSMTTLTTWEDIDCSASAPSAVGLIFEIFETSWNYRAAGLRKNGSTDARINNVASHYQFAAIIGCDTAQIVEGYIGNTSVDFFLLGYITDGATFNTNATDVSLSGTLAWTDLAALPATSVMGFYEMITTTASVHSLRKNGDTTWVNTGTIRYHAWGLMGCDDSYLVEGYIGNLVVDFFVVGYATAGAGGTTVTPDVISLNNTHYIPILKFGITPVTLSLSDTEYSSVLKFGIIPSTLSLNDTEYIPVLVSGIVVGLVALNMAKNIPILKFGIIPGVLSLSDTEYASIISVGAIITPSALSLILTEYTPIIQHKIIIGKLDIATSTYIPILDTKITPDLLEFLLTKYIPIINIGEASGLVTPTALTLMLSFYAPSIVTKDSILAITGRYGIEPDTTWLDSISKSGRYGG